MHIRFYVKLPYSTALSADVAGAWHVQRASKQACPFAHAGEWQVMRIGAVGRHCAGTLSASSLRAEWESSDSPAQASRLNLNLGK